MKKFRDDLKFVLHASFIIIKGDIIHIYAQVSLKYFSKLKKKKDNHKCKKVLCQ